MIKRWENYILNDIVYILKSFFTYLSICIMYHTRLHICLKYYINRIPKKKKGKLVSSFMSQRLFSNKYNGSQLLPL